MNFIKLSDKQKEVIKHLRSSPTSYIVWIYRSQKYYLKGIMGTFTPIRDQTARKLRHHKLIEETEYSDLSSYKFILTELGKTIQL